MHPLSKSLAAASDLLLFTLANLSSLEDDCRFLTSQAFDLTTVTIQTSFLPFPGSYQLPIGIKATKNEWNRNDNCLPDSA